MRHEKLFLIAVLFALTVCTFLSGCVTTTDGEPRPKTVEKQLVIPDFTDPKEQYNFARVYQDSQLLSGEKERRAIQLDKTRQCYERVVKNFPNDQRHTPLAKLEIADCIADQGNYDQAISLYEEISNDYGEEYIQARAIFSIGRVHDRKGEFQKAKDVYRSIQERFGASRSGAVHEIVKKASMLYIQVREKPKGGKSVLNLRD